MVCPKISIVTPVFNQVRYIEETIKSILDQGYPNLEYIIIDGGSTDGTVDIIKKYESQLAYWVSEPDHGLYDALQKGFDHSTGDIMAWLNADDLYVNGCLKNVANVFENHKEINWLTGTHTHCDSNGNILYNWPGRRFCKYHFLMRDYQWIGQENTFWRRSLWERAGSRLAVEMRLAGDFELWLRFFNYHNRMLLSLPLQPCNGLQVLLQTPRQTHPHHDMSAVLQIEAIACTRRMRYQDPDPSVVPVLYVLITR